MPGSNDVIGLRYVIEVVQAGSLSKAACRLGRHSSTLSRRISKIEDALGITLFERTRVGVRVTASGRPVLDQIHRAINELDAVADTAERNGAGGAGEIRVGFGIPPVAGLLFKALSDWRERHPNIALRFSEMNDHQLRLALTERKIDAAFIARQVLWSGAASIPMTREAITVALPDNHELAIYESLTWGQLREETFLTQGWDDSHFAREFLVSLIGNGVIIQSHATSKQAILGFVAAGYGVALASETQARVALPGLVFRPISEANAWVDIDLVWLKETEDAAAGVFVSYMRDRSTLGGG